MKDAGQIKIVRIIDRLVVGGPTKSAIRLATGLGANFATCLVVGSAAAGECDVSHQAREAGIDLTSLPELSREVRPRDIKVILKLIYLFFRLRPDIVATHKSKAGATGRIAALVYKWATPSVLWLRSRNVKVVHCFHGHVLDGYFGRFKTALFIRIERLLARVATDAIIVISPQQRQELCDEFQIGRPEQYHTIPLAVDFEELRLAPGRLRSAHQIPPDAFLVGGIGRLCEIKNFGLLLHAMHEAIRSSATRSSWRLAIIGGGHLQLELEQMASDLGIGSNVTFTGFREDATSFYADLDLVALSSLNEGTPLTLLEGMAAGRPALSTEVGGVVDIMGKCHGSQNGFRIWEHGVTVPSRDMGAFTRALIFLAENPELREKMGRIAQCYVREAFAKERLFAEMERLYTGLFVAGSSAKENPMIDRRSATRLHRDP